LVVLGGKRKGQDRCDIHWSKLKLAVGSKLEPGAKLSTTVRIKNLLHPSDEAQEIRRIGEDNKCFYMKLMMTLNNEFVC